MNISVAIGAILCVFSSLLFAQVNTETYRSSARLDGVGQTIYTQFDYLSGNSETLQIKPRYRIDYRQNDWTMFSVAEMRYGNQRGAKFLNQGFIHGRVVKQIASSNYVELFVQKQYDDFRLLTDRQLLGLNYRWVWCDEKSALGLGAMLENETRTNEGATSLVRLNSYWSSLWEEDNFKWSTTLYLQPAFRDPSDYRLLFESGLSSRLGASNVSLRTTLKCAYDSDPADSVKPYDISMSSGVEFQL